ncbi:hypothetical protein K488DRAFT_42193 [Vararia minispora EC-137]|uniref:Uncharacterized protein n=1 Tax=Vararia minispora EC-137 TaxID=1314806 RepID=A0ACB8QW84_9AGAM|nr:hypothetical protein K488DRAFT_42193 [Vararia minispora EC-137]
MPTNLPPDRSAEPDPVDEILSALSKDGRPIIAVDLDDVLAQTAKCAADWHNSTYGSEMDISAFYHALWYKCPGWGSIPETLLKVYKFYAADELKNALAVPGARKNVEKIRQLGFNPVIVTARHFDSELQSTQKWLRHHFEGQGRRPSGSSPTNRLRQRVGCFQHVIFSKQEKPCICNALQARALVDDILETAMACDEGGSFSVLLFGDYEWNKRIDDGSLWHFTEKLEKEGGRPWWIDEEVDVAALKRVTRVRTWEETAAFIERLK